MPRTPLDTGARKPGTARPSGDSAGRERNAGQLFQGGTSDDSSHPSPGRHKDAGHAPEAPRAGRKADAMGEFAESDEGHEKKVEAGPGPRAGIGRKDATFENDPGD